MRRNQNNTIQFPTYFKLTVSLIGICLLVYSLTAAKAILLPLLWSVFIALMVLPIVQFLESKRWPRVLAILLAIVLVVVVVGLIFFYLSTQLVGLMKELPSISSKATNFILQVRSSLEENFGFTFDTLGNDLIASIPGLFRQFSDTIRDMVAGTIEAFGMLFIMPVYIFLMLLYRDRFITFLRKLYAKRQPESVVQLVNKASNVVKSYLSGMMWVTLIVATLVSIIFFVLGVKYAVFFALFVAVFNLIPYVGVFIASTVSVLYVFLTTDSLLYPILTLALLWGVQILENNVITPYIMGVKVNINPLVVIIGILVGGIIWGVSGMVLFIPLLGALKVVFDEIEVMKPYGYLLGDKSK